MRQFTNDFNTRAASIWSLLEQHYDFADKDVLDVGCGHGDFVKRAELAGAAEIVGIDADIRQAMKQHEYRNNVTLANARAEDFIALNKEKTFDAVLCFSVLPYLEPFFEVHLRNMKRLAREVVFLEVQYRADIGDAGRSEWKNADQALYSLIRIFAHVESIGSTTVKEGRYERDIWKCIP